MARKRDEILDRPATRRRIWFRVEDVEFKLFPLGEAAFLLWVLAGLVLAWLVVAFVLLKL
jgi:hypothetical protein